jgi:hypothetical protein
MLQFRQLLVLIGLLGLAVGGYTAVAQDEGEDVGPPAMEPMGPMMGDEAMPPPPQDRPMMKLRALNQALGDVQLTDQQQQQIQSIRKEHRQQVQQWRKDHEPEFKDLHQKMEEARKQHQPQMERGREMWQKMRQLLESDVKGAELEQQVTQLRQQYKQMQQERKQARQEMQPLHDQMQKLMATAPPAQPVVDKILSVLTAEQRPVVEKRMQEIEAAPGTPGGGPGMGGPGRPGGMEKGGWDNGHKNGGERMRDNGRGDKGGKGNGGQY